MSPSCICPKSVSEATLISHSRTSTTCGLRMSCQRSLRRSNWTNASHFNQGDRMQKRKLGENGLQVSAVGLGCMGMSKGYYSTPGDRQEMVALLRSAVRGAWDWLRPLQPARRGFPHGENRREYQLREFRLPESRSTFYARGPQGEFGVRRSAPQCCGSQKCYAGAGRARLAAGAEALARSDSWHHEAAPTGGKHRS